MFRVRASPAHLRRIDASRRVAGRFDGDEARQRSEEGCGLGGRHDNGNPTDEGNLASPHGIWVDPHGDIYVGEVTQTSMGNRGWEYKAGSPAVRKFIRVR